MQEATRIRTGNLGTRGYDDSQTILLEGYEDTQWGSLFFRCTGKRLRGYAVGITFLNNLQKVTSVTILLKGYEDTQSEFRYI